MIEPRGSWVFSCIALEQILIDQGKERWFGPRNHILDLSSSGKINTVLEICIPNTWMGAANTKNQAL